MDPMVPLRALALDAYGRTVENAKLSPVMKIYCSKMRAPDPEGVGSSHYWWAAGEFVIVFGVPKRTARERRVEAGKKDIYHPGASDVKSAPRV